MKNKLLFVIPNLSGGGAELVLINLLEKMEIYKDELDIDLFCLFDDGVHKENIPNFVNYTTFFKSRPKGIGRFIKYMPRYILWKLFIRKDYDLVISYLEGYSTKIVSGYNGKKINWIHRSFDNFSFLTAPYRSKGEMKKTYNSYDKTIFVSEESMRSFNQYNVVPIEKEKVIYNSLNIDKMLILSKEKIEEGIFFADDMNIIAVGRYTEQKAFDRLIMIAKNLVKEKGYSNLKFYIIGEGEKRSEYEILIKKYELEKHVFLMGFKNNPYKYLKKADLFVCSSLWEGYSTVVTEALILGVPVITTNCSGMSELLGNNEYGIITENSSEELARGLEDLIVNKSKYQHYKDRANDRGKDLVDRNNEIEFYTLLKEMEII